MPPLWPNGPAPHDVLVRAALANDRGFTSAGTVDDEQLAALEAAIAVADRDDTTSYARLLACRAQELVFTAQEELRLASAREAIELIERSDDPTALPRMISGVVWGLWGPDRHPRPPASAHRSGRHDGGRGGRPVPRVLREPRRVLRRHRVRRRRGGPSQLGPDAGDRRPVRRAAPSLALHGVRGVRSHHGGPPRRRRAALRHRAGARHRDRRAQRVHALRGTALRQLVLRRPLRRGHPAARGGPRGHARHPPLQAGVRHQLRGGGPRGRGPHDPPRGSRRRHRQPPAATSSG